MSEGRRWFLLLAALLAIATAGGCAGGETRQYSSQLTPLVGKADKAYFIEKYGEPDKRTVTDAATETWEYRFGTQNLNDYGSRGNLTTATQLRLTFRNGILASWQAANVLN